ncbi:MAG: hypothetical protein ABIK44_04840 [candidate division WOR-3 bacterium]
MKSVKPSPGCNFVIALLLLTGLTGCRRSMAPVLWKIEGDTVVTVGDSGKYQCYVWSPRGPAIDYRWECTGGRFAWDWGNITKWYAPESSGKAVLRITVSDTFGASDTDSLVVRVRPLSRTLVNWSGAVKARAYQFFADTIRIGYRLKGQSDSDTTSVYLLLMNHSNFELWRQGQPAEFLEQRPLFVRTPFWETIPATDRYYFVIDNTRSFRDVNFWLSVTGTSP